MLRSIRKTLSAKPWIPVVAVFLAFVGLWVAFIIFAVQHQPPQVERVARSAAPASQP